MSSGSNSQMAPQQGRPRQEAVNSNAQAQDSDEAPPVTAACEQCRSRKVRCDRRIPHCSNCEKAGVVCEFPHRGKRINQVKQLTEIVSGLAARLDSIDGSINNLVQHMSIHSTSSPESTRTSKTSRSSSACLTDLSISDAEDMDMMFYPEQGSGKNLIPGDRGQIDSTQGGACDIVDSGIPWGPIGARALFESSKRALGDLVEKLAKSTSSPDTSDSENNASLTASNVLAKSNPTIESELKTAYGMYPLQNYQEPSIYSDNGQKVASPPRSLLETSIQYFLDEFNIITPIFQESKLRQAIDMHYSVGGSKGDEAWDLCFNNIIVLTLGLKSRLARMDPSFTQGMNDELLPAFLNNSLRAFQHLDSFLQPRLVNVQALATLAMVAREYHENKVFDMICHMASHVVKFMGLQQSSGVKGNMPDLDEERKDLYWALFVMDKQRTYIAGRPFDIHLYDSDIRSMPTATPQCTHQFRTAHIHMMSIWEEIYISLYSLRAFRKGHSYRQSQVTKLDYLSRKWCARNGHLFSELSSDETPIIANWRIELKYCFHVGNVLIHRSCSEVSSQQIETLNSRAALQIIQGVYKMSPTVGSVALLSRLIRNYPLVALHGLFARFLRNPTYESLGDLDLLNSIGEALGATCDPSVPFACLTRIYVGISWYIDIAKVLRTGLENVLETQKSQEAQQPQQQAAKRSQESFPTSPRARRRISVQLSKKAKNSPPAMTENNPNASFPPTTQANQTAPPWFVSESERPVAFESAQFKPQCSTAPANNFANPTLPAFEPYAEPNSFTDDLSQFLHNTMPFTPTLPVQSRPPGQTQVQQHQQAQSQFQPPLSPLPSKTSMTSSWLSCMPNGGRDASQCDMRDTSIFDSFLACNPVPESWEADFTDQPMFDDFYRVKPT